MQGNTQHFKIRYSGPRRILNTVLGIGPRVSGIEVGPDTVSVSVGWAFSASIPRAAIRSAELANVTAVRKWALGLGNGSGSDVVSLAIDPATKARSMVFPVRLRRLIVSVEDPQGLITALAKSDKPDPGRSIS
jgi:hypothetical protein